MRVKDLCDDGKLRERYRHKTQNAAMRNIPFLMTFEEYCKLMREAGIKSSQLGVRGYHLARYGDVGPYAYGNCRFIYYLANHAEQKVDRAKISAGVRAYYERSPKCLGWFAGKTHKEESKRKIGLANKRLKGNLNSQYGTCWITDGEKNRKIRNGNDLPEGWRLGRVNGCKPREIARHRLP
jgi:hypothetical protein